jgi:hypothetical protein
MHRLLTPERRHLLVDWLLVGGWLPGQQGVLHRVLCRRLRRRYRHPWLQQRLQDGRVPVRHVTPVGAGPGPSPLLYRGLRQHPDLEQPHRHPTPGYRESIDPMSTTVRRRPRVDDGRC